MQTLFLSSLTAILWKSNLNKFPMQSHFAFQIFRSCISYGKRRNFSRRDNYPWELVMCRIIVVIHQIQGWLACPVCQVHYSFIFSILTCLGQCLHHLWIASDSEGKRKQRISFHILERIQKRLWVVSLILSFFLSFILLKSQKSFMWLSWRVYERLQISTPD